MSFGIEEKSKLVRLLPHMQRALQLRQRLRAAELSARAAGAGVGGYARTERGSGYVVFAGESGDTLSRVLPWRGLIFARQKLVLLAELRGLDAKDRITPIGPRGGPL